jgi:hypothetical protein
MTYEVDRRGVGPVEVVESHDQGALAGKPAEQGTEGTQKTVALFGPDGGVLSGVLDERRKHPGEQTYLLVGQIKPVSPDRADRVVERVDDHPKWHVGLELGRPTRSRLVAALLGPNQSFADQRCLPDAGLPGDVDSAVPALAE